MASEADNEMERDEQPEDGSARKPPRVPDPAWLHCPQCGGVQIRKRSGPFLVNGGVCFILWILVLASGRLDMGALALVALVGLVPALFALPVTACAALVGRHRCRSCGRRFTSEGLRQARDVALGFLWRWFVVSFVLLFLLCLIVPLGVRARIAESAPGPDLAVISSIIKFGVFLWVSVSFQVMTYFALRRRLRSQVAWAILLALPALVMGGRSVYLSLPAVRARALLALIGTAALPSSSHDVRIVAWWCPDQSDIYIRFAADPNDITRFLDGSLVLHGAESEWFPAEEMIVIGPEGPSSPDEYVSYLAQNDGPRWFRQRLKVPTRRFLVRSEGPSLKIEVTVDDQRNTVYVHLRHFGDSPPRKNSQPPQDASRLS